MIFAKGLSGAQMGDLANHLLTDRRKTAGVSGPIGRDTVKEPGRIGLPEDALLRARIVEHALLALLTDEAGSEQGCAGIQP